MRKLSPSTALERAAVGHGGGAGSEWEHPGRPLLSQKTCLLHFVCGFAGMNRKNKNTTVVIILILNEEN